LRFRHKFRGEDKACRFKLEIQSFDLRTKLLLNSQSLVALSGKHGFGFWRYGLGHGQEW